MFRVNKNQIINFIEKVIVEKMMSFACGTLLGDIFFHMFPHLFELGEKHDCSHRDEMHHHSHHTKEYAFILMGIIIFFSIESFFLIITK